MHNEDKLDILNGVIIRVVIFIENDKLGDFKVVQRKK